MPFIPAVNCAEIRINGVQGGQPCSMSIDAVFPSAFDGTDLASLAAAVDGWANIHLLGVLGDDVFYKGVTVTGLDALDAAQSILDEPLPGGNGTNALPANVAVCITKYTGAIGRSQRGRMYVWGVPIAYQASARTMTGGAQALYSDVFDNLLVAIGAEGWSAVVLSYITGGVPRVTAQIRQIVAIEARDARLDTQRRRLGATA